MCTICAIPCVVTEMWKNVLKPHWVMLSTYAHNSGHVPHAILYYIFPLPLLHV